MKLSMQTYTVRDKIENDLWGTLKGLRDMGLGYIEIGGTFGLPVKEFKDRLDGLGLKISGNHVGVAELEGNFERIVEENRILDNHYVILPSVDKELYSLGWASVARRVEPLGAKLRDAGFAFAYHNHAFEFPLENGKPGLDVLYETADPALLQAQIDTYWVAYGGGDPAAYIRKLSGRVPLVHFKDGETGRGEPYFLEAGQGELDWDDILAACKTSTVDFGAIELDFCPRDSMESARMCVDFFRARGITE